MRSKAAVNNNKFSTFKMHNTEIKITQRDGDLKFDKRSVYNDIFKENAFVFLEIRGLYNFMTHYFQQC
jgi:hypothetical protein